MILKALLKNPLSLHFKWVKHLRQVQRKHKGQYVKIGYQSIIHQSKLGKYCTVYDQCLISNSNIGDYTYIANNSRIVNADVGHYCSIAQNVQINLGIHPTNYKSTSPIFFSKRKQCQISLSKENLIEEIKSIEIGSDVWIGANAVIMGGIKVGHGAIIAAGAVVTKDVAPYSIVGGVPAKHIKYRFSEETISQLLDEQWWLKPHIELKLELKDFQKTIL